MKTSAAIAALSFLACRKAGAFAPASGRPGAASRLFLDPSDMITATDIEGALRESGTVAQESASGLREMAGLAAAAVASALGISSGMGGDKKSEVVVPPSEPEPVVDVSVPYDAAARLAFERSGIADPSAFEAFRALYVTKAVADVTVKKMRRELDGVRAVADRAAASMAEMGASNGDGDGTPHFIEG